MKYGSLSGVPGKGTLTLSKGEGERLSTCNDRQYDYFFCVMGLFLLVTVRGICESTPYRSLFFYGRDLG